MIDTILIPMIGEEIDDLLLWLRRLPDPGMSCKLVFAIDSKWSEDGPKRVLKVLRETKLNEISDPKFMSCDLSKKESFYLRGESSNFDIEQYPYGTISGPNIQFFRAMRHVATDQSYGDVILLETDTILTKRKWLREINIRTNFAKRSAFVVGARSKDIVLPIIRNHINGNAIYFSKSNGFLEFLENWENVLLRSLIKNHKLAYDVVLDWAYNSALSVDGFESLKSLHACRRGIIELPYLICNLEPYASNFETPEKALSGAIEAGFVVVHCGGRLKNIEIPQNSCNSFSDKIERIFPGSGLGFLAALDGGQTSQKS